MQIFWGGGGANEVHYDKCGIDGNEAGVDLVLIERFQA